MIENNIKRQARKRGRAHHAFTGGFLRSDFQFIVQLSSLLNLAKLYRDQGPGPEIIILSSCSTWHEIFYANKYENVNNSWHFHI